MAMYAHALKSLALLGCAGAALALPACVAGKPPAGPDAFQARAASAYQAASGSRPARLPSRSSRFTIDASRLSAAEPVKYWSALVYPRTVEVDRMSAPGRAEIVFPWETGGINVWIRDMRGARFYGECDIATDPVPAGFTFQPRVQERMTNEAPPQTLRMSFDPTTRKWFFITSQSQIEMPILSVNATDNRLPAGFNWILQGCTILPFKG